MMLALRQDRGWAAPVLLAAAAAAVYLILQPMSADLAAQTYRAGLFRAHGLTLWDGQWYGGHHIPGYSVLFPPIAAYLGPSLAAALAAVAAAGLFGVLAHRRFGAGARVGAAWFGLATAAVLLSGRLTFGFGIALGLGSLLALEGDRRRLGLGLAVLTGLASPVASLFLALAGAAWWIGGKRTIGLWLAAAALLPLAVLAALFPEGGTEPFAFSAFWPGPVAAALALLVLPREERVLRAGAALFALAATAAFLIESPLGGNVMRLGPLVAGPLAACVLWERRPRALALMAVPLLIWQWSPAVRDVHTASGDPAVRQTYYQPLLGYLAATHTPPGRIEIPFTRDHWEAAYVAPVMPLARGWERQLDLRDDRIFYEHKLTPARYHHWLRTLGVRWVALPDAPLDYAAEQEAALIRRGLPYLRPVWHSEHWRVFAVRDPAPMATGAATLTKLTATSATLHAHRAGETVLRLHYTPYWALAEGNGCVSATPGGWTRITIAEPGPIELITRFGLDRIRSTSPRCSQPAA